MSKHNKPYHNYNNYSSNNNPRVEEPVVETEEVVVEQVEVKEEIVEPTPVVESTPETVEESTTVIGIVSDCARLRVRKEPSTDAEVLCELEEGSEVVVDMKAHTTHDFYKVCTAAGLEGYCMTNFIVLK